MNLALWSKAIRDVRLLLASLMLLMFVFPWLFIWQTSQIDLPAFSQFLLDALPKRWERLSGVPFREVATNAGRVALAFVHPVVIFSLTVWAISRGSDIVSGELGRGTLEMVLSQPVRRASVYGIQAAVTTLGSAVLCGALWLGTTIGLHHVPLEPPVAAAIYGPPAANLFAFAFCLAGITALVSAVDTYRWRTIGIVGAFYVLSLLAKLLARMIPGWERLGYASFISAVEPQLLVGEPERVLPLLVQYNGALLGVGVAAYIAGLFVFSRRDLPAPL